MRIVIVGTGFSGSIMARKIVDEFNCDVDVFEKRNNIAGNMFDYVDNHGILIQKYGPHFINTNKYWIIEYLSNYAEMVPHNCSLMSFIDNKYVQLPFNFTSLQQLIGAKESEIVLKDLRSEFGGRDRVPMFELLNSRSECVRNFSNLLFEKAFRTYSAKQWGIPIDEIDKSVINRVQFCIGYDERFLNKDYQYLPKDGFTKMFENLLSHPKIHLHLGIDANEHLSFLSNEILFDNEIVDLVIYTGAIDELFSCKHGRLPYRTLEFKFDYYNVDKKLPCEIISYPQAEGYTRSTEYKQFNFGCNNKTDTVVVTEYPYEYDPKKPNRNIPCYPVINEKNLALYQKYLNDAEKYKNLFLCGRLAEYKYYNMDLVIESTFEKYEKVREIIKKCKA